MTQDLPQLSPLAQHLHQRSLTSAGVINLHPSSIDRTNTTIHRMVQRELLPSQIESRYQTAGVTSSLELPGRARVETLDRVAPQMDTFLPSPMLQRSTAPMSSDSAPMPSWNTSPAATISPPSANTFRVSRKPASAAVAIPSISHPTTADQIATTVAESTTVQERVRVQHPHDTLLQRNGSEESLLMAKPSSPNSIDPTSPTDPTPISDRLSPQLDASSALSGDRVSPSVSSLPSISIDTSNNSLPLLARFPVAESTTTSVADRAKSVETVDIPRVRVESGGILTSPTVPMTISVNSQPLVIAKLPVMPRSIDKNIMLQAKGLTSVETPSVMIPAMKQTTVMVQPLFQRQLESGTSSIVRRQFASESIDRSQSFTSAESLPLHTQIPINTIARQTESMGTSISMPTAAMPPPPPPSDKSATGVEPNLKQITDRVSRLLTQQLVVERERRGIQQW
jgi:hypothetical protein